MFQKVLDNNIPILLVEPALLKGQATLISGKMKFILTFDELPLKFLKTVHMT